MTQFDEWGRRAVARARPWVWRSIAMGLGLLALGLTTGNLGNLSQALNSTLAVGALLGFGLLVPHHWQDMRKRRWVGAIAILVLSLLIVARGDTIGLLGAALFFFGLSFLTDRDTSGILTALLLTTLLFSLYQIGIAYLLLLWHVEQWFAVEFSRIVGVGLMLGPTALGSSLLMLFSLYALCAFLLSRSGCRTTQDPGPVGTKGGTWPAIGVLFAWLGGLILAVVAYIWLQPPLGSWVLTYWPSPATPTSAPASIPTLTYLDSLPLLYLLLWLVSAIGGLLLRPQPLSLLPRAGRGWWASAGLALLALAIVVLTLDPPSRPQRGTVLFYDAGHLEWGRPVFGRYGARSGGTYGLWPDYLAAYGYEQASGPLSPAKLQEAQVVVLINLPESLDAEETEQLLDFVAAGGGLIIWGEHTGLDRIREPTNELLERLPGAPIQLNFDSAVPTRQGWAEGLTLRPHPAILEIRDPTDLVIAVGASLQTKPPAQPIIVGRFGHADEGDPGDPARNYAGDMRYAPGERLGDVVLAAGVAFGQGRIAVVGDTTPLGSVNLMTSMPFQARLLNWVSSKQPSTVERLVRSKWLAVLLMVGAAVCLTMGRSRSALAGASLVLALTLTLTIRINTAQSSPNIPVGPIAYVDISHQERFDRMLWDETSIGGLGYNLVRNGTVPLLLRQIDAETLAEAEILVVIAPGQPFSAGEVKTIQEFVERGGRLLVSVGWEESEASAPLLGAFGLAVDHIPLGPVEVDRETGLVRFHEAWPVSAAAPGSRAIVEGYGYPLAMYQPWGEGGVVLIGDSSFLLGGTLEGETTYEQGNILLLRDILGEILGIGGSQ